MDLLEFHKSKEERNAIMSQDKEILAHLARWGGEPSWATCVTQHRCKSGGRYQAVVVAVSLGDAV